MFKISPFYKNLLLIVSAFWMPAFYLYSNNVGEAPILEFLILLSFLFLLAYLLFIIFRKVLYNDLQTAIFLSFLYTGVYLFVSIYRYIYVINIGSNFFSFFNKNYYFLFYSLIFIALFVYILSLKKISLNVQKFLFVSFIYLIIFYSVKSSFIYKEIKRVISDYDIFNNNFREVNKSQLKNAQNKLKRDIYYIILDAHASSKSLKKYHGYDNSWFELELRKRGFLLTNDSLSNYGYTVLSIPSSLNMQYHFKKLSHSDLTFGLAYHILKNNNVEFFLRKLDYRCFNVSFSWGPTSKINTTPLLRRLFWGEFTQEFFYQLFSRKALNWFYNFIKRKDHLDQFKSLRNIITKKGPKFVFSHFLCPHAPFVFKKNGFLQASNSNSNSSYIDQLFFIDKHILSLIDLILKQKGFKPIIILQSDHGSHGNLFRPKIKNSFKDTDIKMLKYSMFSAYYLPDFNESKSFDDISPVNNFRFIFNNYFDTNFDILENKINFYFN